VVVAVGQAPKWALAALALAVGIVGTPVAAADENTPCTSGRAKPTMALVDPGAGGVLYATQGLRLTLFQDGEAGVDVRSITAPGARVDAVDAEVGGDAAALLTADQPGPLTVTVLVADRDPALDPGDTGADTECTHTVSANFDILPATATKIGKLRRPRLVDRARNLWYRRVVYSFAVTPSGPGANRSPITVRARVARRAKFPGARARAISWTYGMREFDYVENHGCNLICAPLGPRGFSKGTGVDVEELGPRGLKVFVHVPTGYFSRNALDGRLIPTPFGVDVEVFQSGMRIARLRAAGRCDSYGQAANCHFKKARTNP
jgi:hypothetical protein